MRDLFLLRRLFADFRLRAGVAERFARGEVEAVDGAGRGVGSFASGGAETDAATLSFIGVISIFPGSVGDKTAFEVCCATDTVSFTFVLIALVESVVGLGNEPKLNRVNG